METTERLFGVADACDLLSIKRTQFYKIVAAGQLEAKKIGSKTVVPGSSINRYIASLPSMKRAA